VTLPYEGERQEVLDACLRLADRGFLAGTGGNVSRRCSDGLLAITPSGVDYYSMSAADVCVVRLDTLAVVVGERRPSIECGLHAAMLRFRDDASAVIHTHQPMASALALMYRSLPGIERVPYAPSGTWLLVRALRRRLRRDVNAYTLRNHGFICCGATMAAAIGEAEAAEQAAADYLGV
jgi:L-fuculose-phosphate aldolase